MPQNKANSEQSFKFLCNTDDYEVMHHSKANSEQVLNLIVIMVEYGVMNQMELCFETNQFQYEILIFFVFLMIIEAYSV